MNLTILTSGVSSPKYLPLLRDAKNDENGSSLFEVKVKVEGNTLIANKDITPTDIDSKSLRHLCYTSLACGIIGATIGLTQDPWGGMSKGACIAVDAAIGFSLPVTVPVGIAAVAFVFCIFYD